MNIIVILLLVGCLQVSARVSSQGVTLNVRNARLDKVFEEIKKQTGYTFMYTETMLRESKRVSMNIKNLTLQNTLIICFSSQPFTYEIIDQTVVVQPKEKTAISANSVMALPPAEIHGKVVNQKGEAVPNASVLIAGTKIGTTTNSDGRYTFTAPDNKNDMLEISSVGYQTKRVNVGRKTEINVVLESINTGLNEVVVIGYGTQKKRDLTGAVYSVKSEKFQDMPNTNIMEGLQGIVPGLVVTNTESNPGASPQILIRGVNSLSASNDPLIILDGIPFEGNINDISTNDIESANVLKDASASAIYGARAANGVIILTTKRGKTGKAQITYHGYSGLANAEKMLDMMDGPQYFQLKVDIAKTKGNVTDFSPQAILNSAELPQYNSGTTTDWQNMVLRTAVQQEHSLSISGGSEKTKYFTSLNYLNQEGIMKYTGMRRMTLRSNIDHEINDWLKTGVNIQLVNKDLGGSNFSRNTDFTGKLPDWADALRISPYGQLKDVAGRFTFYPEFPNTFYNFSNPFANDGSTADNVTNRAIINLYGEIKFPFLKGLSYRLNSGIDYNNQEEGYYWPSYTSYGFPFSGVAETDNSNGKRWTWENILKYEKKISGHLIDFTGLFSREGFSGKTNQQIGKGFVNDDNSYHYMASADSKQITSTLIETNLESYMARVNYNFKSKYFFTATGRKDGYSGFGKNNKYGFFPSVALAWIPTQELFFQTARSFKFLDYLKIRASVGKNGNMGISPYQTLDAFKIAHYVFGNNPTTANGLLLKTVGNPDLKWESTTTFNAGIDISVLENRISGSVDYYRSHSNDLLMTRQIPVMNGYTSIWYNIGQTENKGIEVSLNTVNIQRSRFKWVTNLNFSRNRDKILKLRGDGKNDLGNKWFVGAPLRVYYDYNRIGIWQEKEDIANSSMPSAKPGFPKLQDVNNDGKITTDDRVVLGSRLPSWVGGITNTLSYGNWALSVYIYTVQGILKVDNIEGTYIDVPYWREDRPSNKFAARGIIEPIAHGTYRDASFVRIKNASLAYNLSAKKLDKLKISNLKLYVSAKNLYTFTNWLGYDPEASSNDITYFDGPYPNSRTIVMGINLTF